MRVGPEQGRRLAGGPAGQGNGRSSAACQALAATVVLSGAQRVSWGTGCRRRSTWEGEKERLEPHHLHSVFSQRADLFIVWK